MGVVEGAVVSREAHCSLVSTLSRTVSFPVQALGAAPASPRLQKHTGAQTSGRQSLTECFY